MQITKSSRHQRIIGDFGESEVCNWLARSGFEVVVVDHTGLDIIAYHPKTQQRLGITVKSRTRVGTEQTSVHIFSKLKGGRNKLGQVCQDFACEPWIAVYVETSTHADMYLTSLSNYDKNHGGNTGKAWDDWKMTANAKKSYEGDPNVKHIGLTFRADNWW